MTYFCFLFIVLNFYILGSVITGIPDYTEVGMTLEEWKVWYMNVCSLIFQKLDENECAIFCQTDVKIHHV